MEQPAAFARKILVNQATSWWRRKSSSELPMRVPDRDRRGCTPPGSRPAAQSRNAVLGLPPRQRAIVVLHYYEDLTEADAADVSASRWGRSRADARAGLRHARDRC